MYISRMHLSYDDLTLGMNRLALSRW